MLLLADIGGSQHAQSLGVGGHDSVLDSVVHHLYKMAGPVGTAVQVALFGGSLGRLASGCAWYVAHALRQRREDWIEPFHRIGFTANHHAVTSFQSPHV